MSQSQNDLVNVAGPGAYQDLGEDPAPLLQGATSEEFVEIFNPLSSDFMGQIGVTRPVTAEITIGRAKEAPGVTRNENDIRQMYGLDLNNSDHQAKRAITNTVLIKSGGTLRLNGDAAQVVVRQLVNEIMQREGQKLLLANAHARRAVEERVVKYRGYIDLQNINTPQNIVNEEVENEFPELNEGSREFTETSQTSPGDPSTLEKRSPGRPKGSKNS